MEFKRGDRIVLVGRGYSFSTGTIGTVVGREAEGIIQFLPDGRDSYRLALDEDFELMNKNRRIG